MAKLDLTGFDEEIQKNQTPEKQIDVSKFDEEESTDDTALPDLGRAIAQGATFGGADELYGAGAAATDVIAGKRNLSDLLNAYREHQKAAEAEYTAAQERHPGLTTVGEIGGGFLVPGLGTAGALKGLSTAAKIAKGAKLGALTGAIGGGLTSKETIEGSPLALAGDISQTAILGGVLGGGATAIGQGLSNAKKALSPKESQAMRQLSLAAKEGMAGKGFLTSSSKSRVEQETSQAVQDLFDRLEKAKKYGTEQYSDFIQSFKEPLKPDLSIDKLDQAQDILNLIESKKMVAGQSAANKIIDDIVAFKQGKLTPQEIKNLELRVKDIQQNVGGEGTSVFRNFQKILDESLQTLPGYDKVNKTFAHTREASEKLLSNVGDIKGANETLISDISKPKETLVKGIRGILEKAEDEALSGRKESRKLDQFTEYLRALRQENPEILKKMGIKDVNDYAKQLERAADIENIYQNIQMKDTLNKSALIGTGKSLAFGAANIGGQAAGVAGDVLNQLGAQKLKGAAGKLTKITDETAGDIIQKLQGTKYGHLANELAANKGPASRNAILFTINQNPELKKILGITEEPTE